LTRNESASTLERLAETAVVRLLAENPSWRQQRLERLAEDRAGRDELLKRRLWQARVDARKALALAKAEDHIPEISRWRAESIEQAHRAVVEARARVASKRIGRRASRDLSAASTRLHELLELAGLADYESFRAKMAEQSAGAREERIAKARAELAIADAAWEAYEAGRHPDADVTIDLRR
jgi:hypothetical protein